MSFQALLRKQLVVSAVRLGETRSAAEVSSDDIAEDLFIPAEYQSTQGIAFLTLRALLQGVEQFLPDNIPVCVSCVVPPD